MTKKDAVISEKAPEIAGKATPVAEAPAYVIKQGGKVVEKPVADNYTVEGKLPWAERVKVLTDLRAQYPRCAFTWVG